LKAHWIRVRADRKVGGRAEALAPRIHGKKADRKIKGAGDKITGETLYY
jgi:hypothetical protein